jgi:hypothetical protein
MDDRNIDVAIATVAAATDDWLLALARHDPDMIRDVAREAARRLSAPALAAPRVGDDVDRAAREAARSIRRVLDANPQAYANGQAELMAAAQWLEQALSAPPAPSAELKALREICACGRIGDAGEAANKMLDIASKAIAAAKGETV